VITTELPCVLGRLVPQPDQTTVLAVHPRHALEVLPFVGLIAEVELRIPQILPRYCLPHSLVPRSLRLRLWLNVMYLALTSRLLTGLVCIATTR
jgi:hypothetical protein